MTLYKKAVRNLISHKTWSPRCVAYHTNKKLYKSSPLKVIPDQCQKITECFYKSKSLSLFIVLKPTSIGVHKKILIIYQHIHSGKCKCQFGGIYAYGRYFIDRNW